jgi:glucosamine--fructose-6-phosphate aminotransferase (isomerizing)
VLVPRPSATTPGAAAAEQHWRRTSSSTSAGHVGPAVALEGALKLKEISYIATDAYAAGEMKHGPIALLDESTPVVVVATDSPVLDKVVSNMQEVRARGAHVIASRPRATWTSASTPRRSARAADRLDAPAAAGGHPAADAGLRDRAPRGLNVDQPRNLAKTVTVE